jgi:hypothetical protein
MEPTVTQDLTHPDRSLALGEEERELLLSELDAVLPALGGERGPAYQALRESVQRGDVPDHQLPLLEGVVSLALDTGRARLVHRADGERVLTELFRRTPRGRAQTEALAGVNRALGTLRGQPLRNVRVAMRTVGVFTVTVETDLAGVALSLGRGGVAVDHVSVGGDDG